MKYPLVLSNIPQFRIPLVICYENYVGIHKYVWRVLFQFPGRKKRKIQMQNSCLTSGRSSETKSSSKITYTCIKSNWTFQQCQKPVYLQFIQFISPGSLQPFRQCHTYQVMLFLTDIKIGFRTTPIYKASISLIFTYNQAWPQVLNAQLLQNNYCQRILLLPESARIPSYQPFSP